MTSFNCEMINCQSHFFNNDIIMTTGAAVNRLLHFFLSDAIVIIIISCHSIYWRISSNILISSTMVSDRDEFNQNLEEAREAAQRAADRYYSLVHQMNGQRSSHGRMNNVNQQLLMPEMQLIRLPPPPPPAGEQQQQPQQQQQ
ncbi:uncharacterized protein LOC141532110 [Cotesia typhae]|uniref:uncharacterized protein LOC141532110 n=1 Tax=Cotesia typhae TaxID=2053667 RepID=UPI003D69EE50